MPGSASVLRRHLGIVHDENAWAEFRASVTKIVNDILDTSRGAPPAAKQGDQLKKTVNEVIRRHEEYFPSNTRSSSKSHIRKYVLDRFHAARDSQRCKEGRRLVKEEGPHRDRSYQPPPAPHAGTPNVNSTAPTRGPILVIRRSVRDRNTNTHRRQPTADPPTPIIPTTYQAPRGDDLLTFLTHECKLPLPQLYPYLKKHGHNIESIIAMSEWDLELIQCSLRQPASLSILEADNGDGSVSGSTSFGSNAPGREVTSAQWDLLAAYIYRLGH
ncbi:hypothetical protein BDN72DRAFT_962547 [Pluteus cervinus]|uniref:Uncharacterized protein n=1 Tax=Pluteus cervinus TaxID=181527 RepID=A0ACD3AIQ7_9AGAR|nr:hypothetical protein BDN72DRAFT_962547 [Pluteus cervinus]